MSTKLGGLFIILCLINNYVYNQSLIIPAPKHLSYQEGSFNLHRKIDLITFEATSTNFSAVTQLKSLLTEPKLFNKTNLQNKHAGKIILAIPPASELKKVNFLERMNPDTLGPEGYHLTITPDTVFITANTPAGLLYGVQSLKQLWRSNASAGSIPNLFITDFPSFQFRGVMDDISRGPISNIKFIKQQIQRLSELKINVFSFYVEHVVKTKSHPGFAPDHGISLEEFEELQDYARAYNIQLLGSFQSLGHFRNILKVPEYTHLGISDRMLDPLNPQAVTFLTDVYSEMIPVFDHPIFNINCDETYDLSRDHLKPIADQTGEGQVFVNHVIPLLNFVTKSGKRPGMWGDMLLKHPEIIPQIPEETTIFTWNYDDRPSFQDFIMPFKQQDLDYIVCPGLVNSNRLWPDYEIALNNIHQFVWDGYKHGAEGVLTTVWDEGGSHFFSRDWYGIAYAADCSWTPTISKSVDFGSRFSNIFYQDPKNLFGDFIKEMIKVSHIDRTANLNNSLFNVELYSDGRLVRLDTQDFYAVKSTVAQANSLLQNLQLRKPFQLDLIQETYWIDLEIWELTTEILLKTMETMEKLIQEKNQWLNLKTSSTLELLDWAEIQRNTYHDLKKDWENLSFKFEHFWNYENNLHWHDEAFAFYTDKIKTLDKIIYRLSSMITELNQNDKLLLNPNPVPYISSDGFLVKYWLGFGPLMTSIKQPFYFDFLEKEGGEKNVRPSAIGYYEDQSGNFIGLKKLISKKPDQVDLSDFYDWQDGSLAYASFRLEAKKERPIFIDIETRANIKIFRNGEELSYRSTAPNTPNISLKCTLEEGWNYFLLKLMTDDGIQPKFSFRIVGESIRQNKYRYYID